MKKSLLWIAAGVICAAVFTLLITNFYKSSKKKDASPPTRAVKLFRVTSANTFGTIAYPGRVRAKTHANLFFRVSGPVIENNLELGMAVKKGDIMMKIDPRDYEREVERLTHNTVILKSRLTYKEQEYQRMERLLKSSAVSKANYELALSSRDAAVAEIKVQETELKIAKDKLADTCLTAPFNGRITDLKIEKFEMAKANEIVVSLQNLETLEIIVHIPEGNIPELHKLGSGGFCGKEFPVTFPGRQLHHTATLKEFRPVTSAENGTYELRFSMTQPEKFMVFPGMTVEVQNLPDRRNIASEKPLVPFSAVFRKNGKEFVWEYIPATKQLTRRQVKVIRVHDNFAEMDSLPAGTLIVAAGGTWLSEMHKITILNPEVLSELD